MATSVTRKLLRPFCQSRQLHGRERHLGEKAAPLSDETTNVGLITVALTPAGKVVLPCAQELLAAVEKTYTAVAEAAVSTQGVIILSEVSSTWRGC